MPVIKQPLSIDDQGNDHIYGVRFIPFYERIDLVSEGIRYQVYDPLIDHEEVDGLFVVIKNPDRVSWWRIAHPIEMPIEERGIFHAEYLFLVGKYGNDQC